MDKVDRRIKILTQMGVRVIEHEWLIAVRVQKQVVEIFLMPFYYRRETPISYIYCSG